MIINVAHTKGGVGKTTISVNLAIEMKADLFDLDNQNSSYNFSLIRPAERATHFYKDKRRLPEIISTYKDDPEKHIIVDSGGYDSDVSRKIILNSNVIITPITVSQTEIDGLLKFNTENIETALSYNNQIKPYILLNKIHHYDAADAEDLKTFIQGAIPAYKILSTTLGARKEYKKAFSEGKSVTENNRRSMASKEIQDLVRELKTIISVQKDRG